MFQMKMSMSSSASLSQRGANATIKILKSFQNGITEDVLLLSNDQKYQDVTIICENGQFQSNRFTLCAIFPVFRTILSSFAESDPVISIPDLDVGELKAFFTSLYQNSSSISITATSMIQKFLSSNCLQTNDLISEQHDTNQDSCTVTNANGMIKEDIEEDFSFSDPDLKENYIKIEEQNEAKPNVSEYPVHA